MQKSEIADKLNDIHHELGMDGELVLHQSLRGQGYDSLDIVEFVMEAEKAFDITVDDKILACVDTPNDVIELISELVQVQNGEE